MSVRHDVTQDHIARPAPEHRIRAKNGVLRTSVRIAFFCVLLLGSGLCSSPANALPLFARQTQQNCVACHVGGQYPELTPYGRYFKLTGYTQGVTQVTRDGVAIPIAFSLQAGINKIRNNIADGNPAASAGSSIDARNGQVAPDQASVYVGGRITDNVGLFAQYTFAWDQGNRSSGTFGADNFDLRYADHVVSGLHDVIWGISLNNNPGVTDVFNTSPAWSYPYQYSASGSATQPPVQTAFESFFGGGTAGGVNGYVYFNKNLYAEAGGYFKTSGISNFLTYTSDSSVPGHNGSVPLSGVNPYFRLAYTTEWGPSNFMVGAFGLRSRISAGDVDPGAHTVYNDRGFDAQYQYISDPSVVSAQFRYTAERISDPSNVAYTNSSGNLHSLYTKAMYVYRAKYGTGLAYWTERGSSDGAYVNTSSANFFSCRDAPVCSKGSPNSKVWIPSIFWQPLQNVRITLYKTYFTQFLGAKKNYDGYGRNASDNNSTYLYLWMDF